MAELRRQVRFLPAYDKRKEGYGIHGVEVSFAVVGENRAVEFVLYTHWHLPHVQTELNEKTELGVYPVRLLGPQPAEIIYHSPVPMREGHTPSTPSCKFTGGACYSDGWSFGADEAFLRLLHEGDDGVWRFLEDEYAKQFGDTSTDP